MPYYKIIVGGLNFSITMEGKQENVGFYTTFILEANSDTEIKQKIRKLLSERLDENMVPDLPMDKWQPYFFIDAVYESEEAQSPKGSTWFTISKFGVFMNEFKYFISRIFLSLGLKNEFYAPERLSARLLKVDFEQ